MTASNYEWARSLLKEAYPGWAGIDEILEKSLRDHFPEGGVVLDVGCGRNSPIASYKPRARLAVGTDIDFGEIRSTSGFHGLVTSDGASLPFAGQRFDLLLSKTAIEHMEDPVKFFEGVNRVLKPGGVFVWATSNLRSMPIMVSRLTPLGVHKWVYRQLFGKQLHIDQFPVFYRANTERTVDRQLAQAGFEKIALHRASWPMYFAFNRPLFRVMLPVHHWTEQLGLQWLQVHLVGIYRKQ